MTTVDIRQAETDKEIGLAREIFREYEAWLGLDLCFQGFEDELKNLPGKYAPPAGRLYLAWAATDVPTLSSRSKTATPVEDGGLSGVHASSLSSRSETATPVEDRGLSGVHAPSLSSRSRTATPVEDRGLNGVDIPAEDRGLNDLEVAGCIALRPLGPKVCEMKRLFVRDQFRGMQIGRLLIERVIADAKEIGYDAMRLDTFPPKMGKAVRLYESYGFREIAPYYDNPNEGVLFMELSMSGGD